MAGQIVGDGFIARLNRARDRWQDHSLTVLLVVQILTIFGLVPAAAAGLPVPRLVSALLLLLFMSITIVVARGRWTLVAGVLTILANPIAAAWQQVHGTVGSDVAVNIGALATFALLSAVVGRAVFRPGPMTGHRVRGAVVLYLNLGLLFAFLHRIVADLVPGAYTNMPAPQSEAAFRAAMDYFSFATLTSVGYGDIAPVHPIARSLATLEGAVGQLLPTVLIGRVITLALMRGPDQPVIEPAAAIGPDPNQTARRDPSG